MRLLDPMRSVLRQLPRPDLRRRALRALRRTAGTPWLGPVGRRLERRLGGSAREAPDGPVVLVLFNTLARDGRFWGNMQLSLFSGELARLGIDNELVVLLMRPGEEARNRRTVDDFVTAMQRERPAYVVFWAQWLPWLPTRLRAVTGARVLSLDPAQPGDIPEPLRAMNPHGAALAAVAGARTDREAARVLEPADPIAKFAPRFDYRFVGADGPIEQRIAFVSLLACPYGAAVDDNPHFRDLSLGPEVSRRGCSYCNAARDYAPMDEHEKRRQLAHQLRTLQGALPALEEIAVPFPEDYLTALADVVGRAAEHGIAPTTLSGQFNSESLGQCEHELDGLLTAVERAGFAFRVGVVGLESFVAEDLRLYNRGAPDDVRAALAVLRRLRRRHDPAAFMPRTVGSLIPFHPWQTVGGLRRTLDALHRERVEALFWRVNLNDVRFHPGVPLYHRAAADGLLAEPEADAVQDVPLGGYFTEFPWRFRDARVAAVHRWFSGLQDRVQGRVALLEACVRRVERGGSPDEIAALPAPAEVAGELDRMAAWCASTPVPGLAGRRWLTLDGSSDVGLARPLGAAGGATDRASALAALAEDGPLDGARIALLGPEPTLLDWLPALVEELRGRGAASIELYTHGRRLAYPAYTARLAAAGVDAVTLWLHHPDPAGHDARVRVPGAFAGAVTAARVIRAVRGRGDRPLRLGVAAVAHDDAPLALPAMARRARALGAHRLEVVLTLEHLALDRLAATRAAAAGCVAAARRAGLAAGASDAVPLDWSSPDDAPPADPAADHRPHADLVR